MPRIEPFYGIRYAPSIPISEAIAPPYDIVSAGERSMFAARNRANAIHVELPVERSGFANRYEVAADIWTGWLEDGIVMYDHDPSLYIYRMTPPNGRPTTGIVGALVLEPPGDGILPHEETIPKDKSDRLELLRHCRANISPIWGLSLAPGLAALYTPSPSVPLVAKAMDDESVLHELWKISDGAAIEEICRTVAKAPVVVADGHHRYETALAFSEEQGGSPLARAGEGSRSGSSDGDGGVASNAHGFSTDSGWLGTGTGTGVVMALIVELSEDQLSVLPIHRTVSVASLGSMDSMQLTGAFGEYFQLEDIGPLDRATAMNAVMDGRMAIVSRDGMWELVRRDKDEEVDSSLVSKAISALATSLGSRDGIDMSYVSDADQAVQAVEREEAGLAVLMRPVTVAQIADYAHRKKRMPPKSTYFWPKPRTGMVFRSLDPPPGVANGYQ
ncbi:MAG: DUF1015 family protein [Acidimicrobiales bacterium]